MIKVMIKKGGLGNVKDLVDDDLTNMEQVN